MKESSMKSFSFSVFAGLLLCTSAVHAQERTAGSNLENQMSWSSLSSQIKAADNKAAGAHTLIQQAILCGASGKVYSPGANGADGQGCKDAAIPASIQTTINNINNSVNTTNSNVTHIQNSLTQLITNMQGCSKTDQIYSGTKCVTPKLEFKSFTVPLCSTPSRVAKCKDDTATANHVCEVNKMTGVSSLVQGAESNPGPNTNNFNAHWDGSKYVAVSAYNYKYFIASLSCYKFSLE